ncbi:MAG: insulinase family protein, partial [Alphaproteobacteria bacterium]
EETERARAQLKANILMARESSAARCEQLANQLLVFGRPIPPEEIADRVDAVDGAAIARVASRLCKSKPTLAALGPIARLEDFERFKRRFG